MPDRLAELRRQRALIQEHLAWLDRQIAEAGGSTSAPASKPAAPQAEAKAVVAAALKASSAATPPPESAEVTAAANAILDEYRSDPNSLKTDVRKGCFLYFFGALALVALGVAVLWWAFRHR